MMEKTRMYIFRGLDPEVCTCCIHVHTCVFVHCACVCVCVHMCLCLCVYMCICVCLCIVHVCTYVCVCVCVCVCDNLHVWRKSHVPPSALLSMPPPPWPDPFAFIGHTHSSRSQWLCPDIYATSMTWRSSLCSSMK